MWPLLRSQGNYRKPSHRYRATVIFRIPVKRNISDQMLKPRIYTLHSTLWNLARSCTVGHTPEACSVGGALGAHCTATIGRLHRHLPLRAPHQRLQERRLDPVFYPLNPDINVRSAVETVMLSARCEVSGRGLYTSCE